MTVNTDNFDVNNWGEFVHKKALNDVIQQINQVDAEQNNAISKISDLANQANQNALNASKLANTAMQSATNAENTANALKNDVDDLKNDVDDLKNNAMMKDPNAYSDFAQVTVTQVNGEAVQNFAGYFNRYKIHNVNGEEFERVEFSISGMYTGDLSKIDVIALDTDHNLLSGTEWVDCHTLITDTNGTQVYMIGGGKVYNHSIRINFDNHRSAINKLTAPYQIQVFCYQTKKITD